VHTNGATVVSLSRLTAKKEGKCICLRRSYFCPTLAQPDALLTAMPDLALTPAQQQEAEEEFAKAMTDEKLFDQQRRAAAATVAPTFGMMGLPFAPANLMAPLVFPPVGTQLVPPQVYESIQHHYLQQVSPRAWNSTMHELCGLVTSSDSPLFVRCGLSFSFVWNTATFSIV
jgi:hypothetical protein